MREKKKANLPHRQKRQESKSIKLGKKQDEKRKQSIIELIKYRKRKERKPLENTPEKKEAKEPEKKNKENTGEQTNWKKKQIGN